MNENKPTQKVQVLTDEDILAKEMQLDGFERDLERAQLELEQIEERIKNGFFKKQAEFLKQDLQRKAKAEVERVEHNLKAVQEQIKTRKVTMQ